MASHFHGLFSRLRQGLRDRVSALSRVTQVRDRLRQRPLLARRLSAAGLLGLALILGSWGYDQAFSDARMSWERSHPPSAEVWTHALGSRGYHRVDKAALLARAARAVPAQLDTMSAIWKSPDSLWVAAFAHPNDTIPFEIYCLECAVPPKHWEPSGVGWTGFESTLREVDRMLSKRKVALKKVRPEPLDPREIRY